MASRTGGTPGSSAIQDHFGINDSPNTVYRTIAAGTLYRAAAYVRSPSAQGTAKLLIREYSISTAALLGETYSDPLQLAPEWQVLTLDYLTTAENTTLSIQVQDYPVVPSEMFLADGIAVRNMTGRDGDSGVARGPAWVDEDTGFAPLLAPNPIRDQSWLRFATSETGALRVEVLDVTGRRVRHVFDERNAPAGVHELVMPRVDDNGRRLGAGIYFYRIEAREGVRTGRFAVLN